MKLQRKNNKGFTLIELLVVITIIGILTTGGVTVYTSQIQKARDTTRITAISDLNGGIEMSYQDNFEYPTTANFYSKVTAYLKQLPKDPKNGQSCNRGATPATDVTCMYVYNVMRDGNGILNGAYEISTAFEQIGNVTGKAEIDPGNDDQRYEVGTLEGDSNSDGTLEHIATNSTALYTGAEVTLCSVSGGGLGIGGTPKTAPTVDAQGDMTIAACN